MRAAARRLLGIWRLGVLAEGGGKATTRETDVSGSIIGEPSRAVSKRWVYARLRRRSTAMAPMPSASPVEGSAVAKAGMAPVEVIAKIAFFQSLETGFARRP